MKVNCKCTKMKGKWNKGEVEKEWVNKLKKKNYNKKKKKTEQRKNMENIK